MTGKDSLVFKTCLACGKGLTGNRKYCDEVDCQRAASAARKARQRAKAKAPVDVAVEAPPETGEGSFEAPWGVTYDSLAHAWADCLLTGGLTGDVSAVDRERRFAALCELFPDA